MPNQMIALQARSPQLPDPSRRTAQFVNMMNMARQQEAAQRQAELAQQTMDINKAQEARAAALQGPALTKAAQDNIVQALGIFREAVGDIAEGDVAAAEAVRADLVSRVPGFDKFLPPATTWDRNTRNRLMMTAEKEIDKTFATPTTETVYGPNNEILEATRGGMPGVAGVRPLLNMPAQGAATPAARATPTAAAPQTNPMAAGATPRTADAEPGSLGLVISSALETGVMSKSDYDKMLSIAQPQSRAKIAAWAQQNNIEIVPDTPGVTDNQMRGAAADFETTPMAYDGQTPQSQFAVYRGQPMQAQTAGMRGAPAMEQTLAQTNVMGQQAYGRSASPTSPLPGSSQVPIERVRQEAVAGRETAGEVYAKEKARARAQREAAIEAGPKPLTPVQEAKLRDNIAKDYKSARSTISMMLDPVSGVVASVNKVRNLSPSQKEAITGYSGYLPSITPGARSADTAIKNLRGKVTEMGKSAAALTGAIGQMAVQEWRIVSDMIASLDIEGMEPADLDNQLDIIEAQARRAAEVTRDAYENQYVEEFARYPGRFQLPSATGKTPVVSRPKAESQLPRIRGNADYNKLKPGTEFIDPNGVRRRKPK